MADSSDESAICHPPSAILLGLAVLLAMVPAARGWDEAIDSVMYRDPTLPMPQVVTVFPERLRRLLLEALERPEAELRCQAALAIARAHQQGMKGLEAAVPALIKALEQPDQHAAVRLAAARALVELDARDAAPSLLRQAQASDEGLRHVIEPALARWDYRPARAVWLERLDRPVPVRGSLSLAISGLAAVREEKAVPGLLRLAAARGTLAPVRLVAARALGEMRTAGLEEDARLLVSQALAN
ncbi:MAG: HEAT repeat domain-containing protein, partial [Gemmataceae bacterium]|nr:HEAT repeat domain-containing protein [Gemmataceae bacterium]